MHYIYRSPTGNFSHILDSILNFLHNNRVEIIICSDFNVNYLNDNDEKSKLDNLLLSHNLYNTVNFPTRIHYNSIMATDNIFIGKVKYENYFIKPLVNGFSDHDAHIITLNVITVDKRIGQTQSIRKFTKFSVSQFAINLSYENWDVFIGEDVNTVFNNFLSTYLRIFDSSFPLQKIYSTRNNKPWITT